MNNVVLLVDDEPAVLKGYLRNLGQMFEVETANSGVQALQMIQAADKYALVMTDYRMPGITGVELLRQVRDLRPDTVRMLITGYADVKISLEAINEGSVFRMLSKPCDTQSFYRAIEDGLRQHELITSEHDLLEQTLKGSVHMLGDIMSVLDHGAFGRGYQLSMAARQVAIAMGIQSSWEVEVAATLCEIGRVTLPSSVSRKRLDSADLAPAERDLLTQLPQFSAKLLSKIPRLESIAHSILYQNKNFDGTGYPADKLRGEYIPIGARILRILNDALVLIQRKQSISDIFPQMLAQDTKYDVTIVKACIRALPQLTPILSIPTATGGPNMVSLQQLRTGHRLISDICTQDGMLIISAGSRITPATLQRIQNFSSIMPIRVPIQVYED